MLTLSLVYDDVSRLKLLMVMRYRCVMVSRTRGVVLYRHHLPSVHIHTVTAEACCVFILY